MPNDIVPAPAFADNSNAAMFRLTDEDIQDFRAVVHKAVGLWMTPEEAATRAYALLTLARVVLDRSEGEGSPEAVQTSSRLHDSYDRSRVGM